MATIHPTRSCARRCVFCVAGLALFAWSARGQYDPDWARHFRIGAIVGLNIKADFQMSGSIPFNHPAGVYDDGYVGVDQTGNAGGVTTYFGYYNPGQYSRGANTLTFHDTTSLSSIGSMSATKDGGALPGFELAYGGNLWYWGRARIGWDFGFGLLPISISAGQSASGTANQSVFTYDTTGQYLPPPPGVYQAPPGATGPYNIPSTPASTNTTATSGATLVGTQTLDVMLYTLRLGPSIYWDFNRYLGMSVGVGPALGIVSGDLKYNETITTATVVQNEGKISKTDLVYGWYANATLLCHLVKHGDIYISGQYMPLGNATISGQGRQGTLKLNGAAYISAGVNWPF